MKAYTDIVQSKKLAEILPPESADMCYIKHSTSNDNTWKYECMPPMVLCNVPLNEITAEHLPCWSLAALINTLPISIKFKDDEYYLRFMKEYVEYANDEISLTGRCLHTTGNDNLVDACFEMILKLKEKNLL